MSTLNGEWNALSIEKKDGVVLKNRELLAEEHLEFSALIRLLFKQIVTTSVLVLYCLLGFA